MTRLKLHYAMQKWYPVDFMSINLDINLLRVQDATFTVYTVFNFEPKWCKKKKSSISGYLEMVFLNISIFMPS